MTEKFYDGSFFDLNDPKNRILIDVRPRSFGRTSFWVNKGIKRAEKRPATSKFIYFRRSEKELDEVIADGFASNMMRTDYYGNYYRKKGYKVDVINKKIYLYNKERNICVGYMKAFNTTKGADLDDVDLIIFDEFIATFRREYKGGNGGTLEPKVFERFIHTVTRRRKNCAVIFLGNQDTEDSSTNPYNEHYKIPFKATKFKRDDIGLVYRRGAGQGDTGSFADVISRANAETYAASVTGNNIDKIDNLFIAQKSTTAFYMCAIKYQSINITLWIDVETGLLYCHDNYKIDNTKPFYTAFYDDMTVATSMLIASTFPQLKAIKMKFFTNQIRYNNVRTAECVKDIIDIIKN